MEREVEGVECDLIKADEIIGAPDEKRSHRTVVVNLIREYGQPSSKWYVCGDVQPFPVVGEEIVVWAE